MEELFLEKVTIYSVAHTTDILNEGKSRLDLLQHSEKLPIKKIRIVVFQISSS